MDFGPDQVPWSGPSLYLRLNFSKELTSNSYEDRS
jgi:hypothetical protein